MVKTELTLELGRNGVITGNVDSTGDKSGILTFIENGSVTGNIGQTNVLQAINLNGQGGVNLGNGNVVKKILLTILAHKSMVCLLVM